MMGVKDLAQFGVPRKTSYFPGIATIVVAVNNIIIVIIQYGVDYTTPLLKSSHDALLHIRGSPYSAWSLVYDIIISVQV